MSAIVYIAAALVGLWGVAHVVPTRQVVRGFAPISRDNRRVLTQEWLAEAVTMWGIAALLVITTALASDATVTAWVYRCSAGLLLALAIFTALTGAPVLADCASPTFRPDGPVHPDEGGCNHGIDPTTGGADYRCVSVT
jgi:hypothetical protein